MRLWSLHPQYLDAAGLVACWREALLAQKVLRGLTTGYRNHPQLVRFRETPDRVAAIGAYLGGLADEADRRGYRFDRTRIVDGATDVPLIPVTDGQVEHERQHLLTKLELRDPERVPAVATVQLLPHRVFRVVPGSVEPWERNRPPERNKHPEPGRDSVHEA